MPIALVHSISLPNLKIYTTISLLLLSGCFYYAFDVVRSDPQWNQNLTSNFAITRPNLKQQSGDALADSELISSLKSSLEQANDLSQEKIQQESSVFEESNQNHTQTLANQLKDVAQFMTHEPICIWVSFVFDIFVSLSRSCIHNS